MTGTQSPDGRTLSPHTLFALIAATTVLGIAGTDLVLPAVPSLPAAFGTTIETAQMVLAAYALGTMLGLLAFGELGARLDPRRLLVWSLGLFTLASLAALLAPSIGGLIALRFAQGAFGAAPAVFAPGFIRGLFHEDKAAGALGRLGSIESLTPALAPIAGAFLLTLGGWRVSFVVIVGLGIVLTAALLALAGQLPGRTAAVEKHKSYGTILMSRRFMRYAISQSFGLGGLLVFVFGMPAVITGSLGLGIGSFVAMQVIGITAFIVGANLSSLLARRFGTERIILAGSAMLALAFVGILVFALLHMRFEAVIGLWIFVNFGFGIRGPIGFNAAVVAAEGDHSRGAALVVAAILATAALGTALVAPFLGLGLLAPAIAGTVITGLAILALLALRD